MITGMIADKSIDLLVVCACVGRHLPTEAFDECEGDDTRTLEQEKLSLKRLPYPSKPERLYCICKTLPIGQPSAGDASREAPERRPVGTTERSSICVHGTMFEGADLPRACRRGRHTMGILSACLTEDVMDGKICYERYSDGIG